MKKIITVICAFALCAILCLTFVCCTPQQAEKLELYVPDGAPALAVAKLARDKKAGNIAVNVHITTGNDVRAKVLSGEADAAIIPTNMAATLYSGGAEYNLVSANIFGLLYLVGRTEVPTLSDLCGKVVYSIGKNNTPEWVFKKILSENNVAFSDGDAAETGKIVIRYFENAAQIMPLLLSGEADFALLGEPAVSKAVSAGMLRLFDLQEMWRDCVGSDNYPQAGLFVKRSLLTGSRATVKALYDAIADNTAFIAENADKVAAILAECGSVDLAGATLNEDVILNCNVRCVGALQCKDALIEYFNAISEINTAFVLPDDGFYFAL